MVERMATMAPRQQARIGGFLYLVIMVTGFFAEGYVRGTLVVRGDAAATAHNILSSQLLFRLGGAVELLTLCCDIAVALILYNLLKPVNQSLAFLAAFFRLVFAAILATSAVTHFLPLRLLADNGNLAAFTADQLQAMALLSLRVHGTGYVISLVFFGVHCVLIGGLIAASNFLPRIIGVLLVIAGCCYLINSFTSLITPTFASRISPYILVPGFVAELSLAVWLSAVGLSSSRWRELASTANPMAGSE